MFKTPAIYQPTLTLLSAILLLASLGAAKADTTTFSFAYDQPEENTAYGVAANIFQAKLEEVSGGSMTINHYPGAQLGSEPQMMQKMRAGDIDFMLSSSAHASTLAPFAGVFSLHYLFRDREHLMQSLSDEAVANVFRGMIDESVQHARVLSLFTLGFRNAYGKTPVKSVADIKGKKIRVQLNRTEDVLFAAYGAQAVHMPFSEVYTSLQTGLMDLAENGLNIYLVNKHYEVAPIISLTEHEANINCLWVSEKAWNSLTTEMRGWVQQAADEVAGKQPAIALQMEDDSAKALNKRGVRIVKDIDKNSFINIAAPIQDQLATELGPEAVKILKLVRAVR